MKTTKVLSFKVFEEYLSFSKKVNRNKQNFARAVLTYLGILILLVVVTTILS